MGISDRPGLDASIFRAYDIRGVYPTELDEAGAYKIAQGIYQYLKPKRVGVGYDARLSAPAVQAAVCRGFADAGSEVVSFGMSGTDMVAWAAGAMDFDVTINVTASHNPKEWIGMKINQRGGEAVGGNGEIQEIGNIVADLNIQYPTSNFEYEGVAKIGLLPAWIDHVLSFIDSSVIKPLKIVVDAGNGVAGPIARELFKRLPIEVVELYFEPDGNFPHHLPSPIEPANVRDLQQRVLGERADLGIAFDGDADRMFLVDDQGRWVSGSETTALVLDELLAQDPKRIVIYNAICGWNVRDVVAKHNAIAYRSKVGHAYAKRDMKRYGACFAGEHSGHYFFKENYNGDSGLIAALVTLGLVSRDGRPLSQILQPYRKYFQIPETNFKVADSKAVMQRLAERYADGVVDWLDGLTVCYPDWWFNVRPSSNEPLLRLNVEAILEELLQGKAAELSAIIRDLA
jgi:phosphomannomutase